MAQEAEGDRIAQSRRELGVTVHRDISQADLARLVGVSGNTVVWNWEEGLKQPSDINRRNLSRVLGVTEAYLRYGTEPKELPDWTPPDLTLLDLPMAKVEDARQALAKKTASRKRRGA